MVSAAGIDTVSFAWRLEHDQAQQLEASCAIGALMPATAWATNDEREAGVMRARRGSFVVTDPIGYSRWLFWPRHRLLVAEGRLAPIALGSESDTLAPLDQLPIAAVRAALEFEQFGFPLFSQGPVAQVRRLDLAAELRFESPGDGLVFLHSCAEVAPSGLKTNTWSHEGRIETVSYLTARTRPLRLRIYDSGVKRESDPPGARIRVERQLRFEKSDQVSAEALDAEALFVEWLEAFAAWSESTRSMSLDLSDRRFERVLAAVVDGRIDQTRAERLLGALVVFRLRGSDWWRAAGRGHVARRRLRDLAAIDADQSRPAGTLEVAAISDAITQAIRQDAL